MSNPQNQHIVSACLLRQFAKNKDNVLKDFELLSDRLIGSIKDIPPDTCYKVLLKDLEKENNFKLYKENIISPKNKNFCKKNLYSQKVSMYKKLIKNNFKSDAKKDLEIKFALEKKFGTFENEFGKFMKFWNESEKIDIDFFNIEYNEKIINFVISNEIRGKHIYDNINVKNIIRRKLTNYINFDKSIFSAFLMSYSDDILKKIDYYEIIDMFNVINMINDNDLLSVIKKEFALSSLNNIGKKYLFILQNDTNLNFLLSDVSTFVIYQNDKNFNRVLNVFANIFKNKPEKITLMPLKNNLLAIVSDSPFIKNGMRTEDIKMIKKINTLFYSRVNEWLVIYDIYLKKNELININFLNYFKNKSFYSGFSNWYKTAQEKESLSCPKYNYFKINKEEYNKIKVIISVLAKIDEGLIKINGSLCLDSKGYVINDNAINASIFIFKIEKDGILLTVKDKDIFNVISNFKDAQIKCFKDILIYNNYISDLIIDYEDRTISFNKNCFFKK